MGRRGHWRWSRCWCCCPGLPGLVSRRLGGDVLQAKTALRDRLAASGRAVVWRTDGDADVDGSRGSGSGRAAAGGRAAGVPGVRDGGAGRAWLGVFPVAAPRGRAGGAAEGACDRAGEGGRGGRRRAAPREVPGRGGAGGAGAGAGGGGGGWRGWGRGRAGRRCRRAACWRSARRRGCSPRPGIWSLPCDRGEAGAFRFRPLRPLRWEALVGYDEELAARASRARDVALFRYGVIPAPADPDLSPRQPGAPVRALAAGQHKDPGGRLLRIGRSTLDRWIRDWRAGGFDALVPGSRNVQPRTSAGVLELAVALKKEKPERTAAQVHRVLAARLGAGQVPSVRTIQRHFVRMELAGLPGAAAPEVFGRFEADAPGELWVSDVLHGPPAGPAPKTYLFGIRDDHSRFITGWCGATREDVTGLFAALRPAVEGPRAPPRLHVDHRRA